MGITVHNRKKFEDELVAARKSSEKALNENTALLQAKRELQEHAELLDQQMYLANKQNDELRQFNRVVTHDLQEPLRKLFVFTNLLLENNGEAVVAKTVQKIRSIAEHMRSLVSGLQQYIWLTETPVKPVPIYLNELVEKIGEEIRRAHPQLSLRIEAEHLPTLLGDAEQLPLLFSEVLANAVRFRKPGEETVIRITSTELQQNKFRNMAGKYQYTPFVKLQISDNGTGFEAIYKEQAFELFKRLHPESGRGIGLPLCKKIVENHHGTIAIDSRKGEGTIVSILLPVQKPPGSSVKEETNVNHQTDHHDGNEAEDHSLCG